MIFQNSCHRLDERLKSKYMFKFRGPFFQFHYVCTPGEGSPVNEELERRLVRPGGGYFESPDLLTQRLEEKPAGDSFTSRTGPLWRPSCFRASIVWVRGIADMTRIVIEIVNFLFVCLLLFGRPPVRFW